MELIRYIFQLFYFNKVDFIFPDDLKYNIALILFPCADSILYYIPKYYMEYNYFSPDFIVCLIGNIYTTISIILLIIFYNIDCGDSKICNLLSGGVTISNKNLVYFYMIKALLNSLRFFIELILINEFSYFFF